MVVSRSVVQQSPRGWAREPMLPLRLFQCRTFAAANVTAFLMTAALLAAAFMLSQYLQVALRQ